MRSHFVTIVLMVSLCLSAPSTKAVEFNLPEGWQMIKQGSQLSYMAADGINGSALTVFPGGRIGLTREVTSQNIHVMARVDQLPDQPGSAIELFLAPGKGAIVKVGWSRNSDSTTITFTAGANPATSKSKSINWKADVVLLRLVRNNDQFSAFVDTEDGTVKKIAAIKWPGRPAAAHMGLMASYAASDKKNSSVVFRFTDLDFDTPESLMQQAEFLISVGSPDTVALLQSAVQFFGEQAEFFTLLASYHGRFGRCTEEIMALKKSVELDGGDASRLNSLGYLMAEQGDDLDAALGYITKAVEKDSVNPYYRDSLGWVFFRIGELSKAITELEKAMSLLGTNPDIDQGTLEVYEHLETLYEKTGAASKRRSHLREAIASLGRHLQGNPDAYVRAGLARLLSKSGDMLRAENEIVLAMRELADHAMLDLLDSSVFETAADIYLARGKKEQALRSLKRAADNYDEFGADHEVKRIQKKMEAMQ